MEPNEINYTPRDLKAIVHISYRQIQYWDKTQFLQPSQKKHGKYRSYSFNDVFEAKLLHKLRDEYGLSVQQLRKIAPNLRAELANNRGDPLELRVVIPNIKSKELVILTSYGDINLSWPGGENFFAYSARCLVRDIKNSDTLSTKTRGELAFEIEEP